MPLTCPRASTQSPLALSLSLPLPSPTDYGLVVGQCYSTLFGSSKDVAGLYDEAHLVAVATDAAAHTSVFAGAGAASLPPWLADHMANQFSHLRNFIYAAIAEEGEEGEGTMREQ
jgi:hypothetical protein